MPDPLRTVAYTSRATRPFDTNAFMTLLASAQRFNATRQVTGLLILSKRSVFVQTLEGSVDDVGLVFDRIEKDASHRDVKIFVDESVKVRVYPDWSMLSEHDNAAQPLIEFLSYALLRAPSPFTRGQRTALSVTLEHLSPA